MRTLNSLARSIEINPLISRIHKEDIEGYLNEQSETLCNKSLLNRHIGLSAFWTWCVSEDLCKENIIRRIRAPRPEEKIVDPLTEEEIRALLTSIQHSKPYKLNGVISGPVEFTLPFASRNKAIIFLLLDTGLRVSELCSISLKDLDLKGQHVNVMGKGDKERQLPFSSRTAQAIYKYIGVRGAAARPEDPLFLSRGKRRLGREELAHTLSNIGKRAKINGKVYPHRFRHTFAINYLRNGGDVYTLQKMLGHSTMEMCRRYLALAQVDLEAAHRRASPVDNWKL
jgi:site-specific recombinase XerD